MPIAKQVVITILSAGKFWIAGGNALMWSGHLKKILSEDEFKELANKKPKPKIVSLVELIEQAKKRVS